MAMDAYEPPGRSNRQRRGLPWSKAAAEAPDLFNEPAPASVTEPRARKTDRATSQRAARRAAVGDLSATQTNILHLVREYVRKHGVGITDDQIVVEFKRYAAENPETVRCPSPQRIRTARADLVRLGYLQDTGQIAPSDLGNDATTWEPKPTP